MSTPLLVTLPDLKTYLGITGTTDDLLLASCASNASIQAEADTGRYFAVRSNHTERYSTNGQASLTILDVPYSDPARTVTWLGAPLTQDTNYWLLPDRRDTDTATTIQLRYYDRSNPEWWKASRNWFDANLDSPRWVYTLGAPNDLVVTGVYGHPTIPGDVVQAVTEYAAWLYYRAKGGASGYVTTPTGQQVDLGTAPEVYKQFVANWRISTGVASI